MVSSQGRSQGRHRGAAADPAIDPSEHSTSAAASAPAANGHAPATLPQPEPAPAGSGSAASHGPAPSSLAAPSRDARKPEAEWQPLGPGIVQAPWYRPGGSPVQLSPRARVLTFWACVAITLLFLWAVRSILRPFIIAIILAYALNPIVTRVSERARLPRAVAVAGIYVILAMLLTWTVLVIFPVTTRETRELAATLPRLIVQLQNSLAQQQTITVLGVEYNLTPLSDELTSSLSSLVSNASRSLLATAVATVETLLKGILALVATFYLLMEGNRIPRAVRALTPPRYRQEFSPVVAEIDRILGRFVRGELLLILIMSFATWLALTILGIRYALLLGILAGVLELIPFIGPITAAVPAVALALFQPSPYGWSPLVNAGLVALVYFLLRHAEDYLVIPQVVGRVVELHPLIAMFAVFSGAAIGGVLGMFLGVPVAAVLRVLSRYVYYKLVEEPK